MANKQICLLLLSCLVVFINVWAQFNSVSEQDQSCIDKPCSCCLETANCSTDTGECYGQCKVGYHGGRCRQNCPENCRQCKDSSIPGEANCTECKHGYYSTPFYYQCQLSCPTGCEKCTNGKDCISCKTGYYKSGCTCSPCQPGCKTCTSDDTCSTCKEGRYGNQCKFDCSINCNNTCDRITDFCDSCAFGFTGNKCCMQGPGCQSCSSDSVCSKCVPGKHGERCDRECSKKCADKTCDMVNGACITCLDGFQGMNCTIPKPSVEFSAAAIGAAVAVFLILIFVVALLVIRLKQRKKNKAPRTNSNTEEVPTDTVCAKDVAIAAASNECSIYQTLTGSYNITDYEQLSLGAIYGDGETRPITKKEKTGKINKLDASMISDKANKSLNQDKSIKPKKVVKACKLHKASKACKMPQQPVAPLQDEHNSDYYNSVANLQHSVAYSDLASHFDKN